MYTKISLTLLLIGIIGLLGSAAMKYMQLIAQSLPT